MWKSLNALKEQVGSNLAGLKETTIKNAGAIGSYTKSMAKDLIDNYEGGEPSENNESPVTDPEPVKIAKKPLKKNKSLQKKTENQIDTESNNISDNTIQNSEDNSFTKKQTPSEIMVDDDNTKTIIDKSNEITQDNTNLGPETNTVIF